MGVVMSVHNILVAKALIRKFTVRRNGLESASGLTAKERRELERLTDLDDYLRSMLEDKVKSLKERAQNVIQLDRGL